MYRFLILCLLCLASCKNNNKTETEAQKPLTLQEKIANAHGFENWKNVSEIHFTFNVDKDSSHYERSWQWKPKTNDVVMLTQTDTVSFNHKKVDSTSMKADKAFINDKFWALIPFQLVWDEGITLSKPIKTEAPISKKQLNKTTLLYSSEGGYTPGDAYDLFYDDNYIIKEWVFRKGNTKEPSMTNTFENTEDFNGIKIAKDHKKTDGNWNLNLTNVKVILEE